MTGQASDLPGILVYNASEIATLAGGLRRGSTQGDIALLSAATDGLGDALYPAVAAYEGRIVAIGTLAEVEAQLEEMGIAPARVARSTRNAAPSPRV